MKNKIIVLFAFMAYTLHGLAQDINGKGMFSGNMKIGKWEYFYDNGNLASEGSYKEGKEEGKWITYHENGDLSGIYYLKAGKFDGEQTSYRGDEIIGVTHMKEGKREGKTYSYVFGEIAEIRIYKDDVIIGDVFDFYGYGLIYNYDHSVSFSLGDGEGRKISKGKMNDEKKEGVWKFFMANTTKSYAWHTENIENLQLIGEQSYKNGVLDGYAKLYSKSGALMYSENYKNGELIESKEYYENGQIKEVVNRDNEKDEEEVKYYNESGKLTQIEIYKNDELIKTIEY